MEISGARNSEYLPAIRSHFGIFGVIYEINLTVRVNRPLSIRIVKVNIDHFLNNFEAELKSIKAENDSVFGMLCPQYRKLYWQTRKSIELDEVRNYSSSAWMNKLGSKNALFKIAISFIRATSPVSCSAFRARILSTVLIQLPLTIVNHIPYTINACDRGKLYGENDAQLDFYDWVFCEEKWVDMARAFLQLSEKFRKENSFGLPLPAFIYFIPRDQTSLLSRSRHANMMAIDPWCGNPQDGTWTKFRLEFNKIAMMHGGIPHVNKTCDSAVNCFGNSIDPAALRRFLEQRAHFDPKNLFLNEHFRTMFADYL